MPGADNVVVVAIRVSGLLSACVDFATSASCQVAIAAPNESHARVSLFGGGEVRQEYEWFDNEEWGAEVPDADGY